MDEEDIEATKSYILTLCSAIGGLEEVEGPDGSVIQKYCVGDEALACLRDLKRAIRTDSQNNERTVLKALVEFNVIETDIVPLLLSFRKDRNEVALRFILACVELLVPMTWPVEKRIDDEDQQDDPNLMSCYRKYKLDLLKEGVFEAILTLIMNSVRIPQRDRSIIDQTTIRLGLYLFRNLTAIPDLNMSQSSNLEHIRMSHMQETLMIRYYESDVTEFLLTIASNSAKQEGTTEWNVLVLESLYNLIKSVDPKDVFSHRMTKTSLDRADLEEAAAKLSGLLNIENTKKRQKTTYVPTRHNRFGGTYVLEWDSKKRISHSQVGGFADPTELIEGQKKTNRSGRKRKLEDKSLTRKVYQNNQSLMYLKLTAQSFIQSCFNAFYTRMMKDMLREDDKILANDYTRYYYTMKWFLEYHGYEQSAASRRRESNLDSTIEEDDIDRTKDFDFSLVASALDLKTVLFCLRQMRTTLDNKQWFELQMAVDCLRQMLLSIGVMAKSQVEEYRAIAEHIQSNMYYEQQHLDLLIELVRCYKNQSDGYLKSVVLLTHVLLRLLDKYQQDKKTLFIRKKAKSSKPKKITAGDQEEPLIADVVDSENEEEDRDRRAIYKDQVFKFDSFEQRYISTDLVHTYCALLENYMDLEPKYMACITSMFHRIMVKRRAEYLFWKLPVLDLFNRILSDVHRVPKTKEFGMLIEFIQYSTYQFFKAAKVYPLLFIEALIPKMRSDRNMWEEPNVERIQAEQEEEEYLNDVNYIPSTTTNNNTEAEQSTETHNNDIIDEEMVDYLFSAFDQRDKEVNTITTTTENHNDSLDLEVETSIAEVDKLLMEMGVETTES
ncbi:timeless protein-domain-containing protein [Pilaira anomala]|nr:timeless protein-domain-containing protein [Pilaira anomala]